MPAKPDSQPTDDAPAAEAVTPEAVDPEVDVDEVPMNRAERRAKGKAGGQPKAAGKIEPGRVNTGQNRRQYSARRSGG